MRVVMITGGSSGIGKALAARLTAEPERYAVVICGRSRGRLEQTIADLEPDARVFQAIQADVTQAADVTRLVSSAMQKFGQIDVLVNSAGAGHLGAFTETDEATMERLWAVNVKGAMLVTQAVLPAMMDQKSGHIVNLCGVLGVKTIANAALYCATKHALTGFGNALAQEVRRYNIRVSNVCCSGVDTPFWEGIPGKPRAEMLLRAEDVAEELVHLLEQPAHVATGMVLMQHVAHQL